MKEGPQLLIHDLLVQNVEMHIHPMFATIGNGWRVKIGPSGPFFILGQLMALQLD